ncbi:MAG: aspartate aminotransferase family protein [Hyphomicrobiaceae bacterium]|nr:MAG: aspartate aminotransferase family protein [Hyphomicrobiaceae bacterium]
MSALMPNYAPPKDIVIDRGEGTWLIGVDGTRYLDLMSGVAVASLGHAHPRLVAALTEQAQKVWQISNHFRIAPQERLAERLVKATFADRAFFCNSGGEALEAAIKMARRYHYCSGHPERYRLVTFEGAFHGRTLATIAAGGNKKYLEGFGPVVDGFDQVPFGDIEAVKKAIGPNTAGILIEPIAGEGGIKVPPRGFLKALRELCDKDGLLLVLDEVQCGMGRTGKLFAHEHEGIKPDIMAVAKAVGGGFPLGACLATEAVAKHMTPGTHGSTYGGNPLATAVGMAVLDVMLEPGFLEEVRRKSLLFKQRLAALKDEFPHVIEEVRGEGLMLGLKLKPAVAELQKACFAEHLLVMPAGENVLRLLPPLTIADAEISSAMDRLARAMRRLPRPAKS